MDTMKAAVVYWSSTGNTETMANAVLEGAKTAGIDADLIPAGEFSGSMLGDYDAVAFGCPAMGAEVLEEDEFEPMFSACKPALKGKKIALFGSYGWGDGEWMRSWEATAKSYGAHLEREGVICTDAPDTAAKAACEALGKALA